MANLNAFDTNPKIGKHHSTESQGSLMNERFKITWTVVLELIVDAQSLAAAAALKEFRATIRPFRLN